LTKRESNASLPADGVKIQGIELRASQPTQLKHHDLCFGCGLANPFGLQLVLEPGSDGDLSGRFFVKQDHQGPSGSAHSGVLAAALGDAMSLAVGPESGASTASLRIELPGQAAVGSYVHVTARVEKREGHEHWAAAELRDDDGGLVAEGRALFVGPGADG
jgi:acyl-coenzyme A thioesterase PaaI-like protein